MIARRFTDFRVTTLVFRLFAAISTRLSSRQFRLGFLRGNFDTIRRALYTFGLIRALCTYVRINSRPRLMEHAGNGNWDETRGV